MQRPIINQCPVEQTAYRREIKDNGYKSVFTNSWLVRQRNRSWIKGIIRQKSTKRVNSFIACSAFCPGPPNSDPMDSEKRLHVYKSSATCGVLTRLLPKIKIKMIRPSKKIACLYGLRCELVKIHKPAHWLPSCLQES